MSDSSAGSEDVLRLLMFDEEEEEQIDRLVDDDDDEEEEEEEEEEDEEEKEQDVGYEDDDEAIGDESLTLTLTDQDVFDCPVCFETLSIPVFECENGHLACSPCCAKLRNKCPSCSRPIGRHRCRGIEKVLESVRISCRNKKYGCKAMVTYIKKHEHEETCIYAPCSCPLRDCDYVGSSKNLYLHFSSKHSNSTKLFFNFHIPITLEIQQKYLILQARGEGTIFIVNNGVERLGNVINVSCIAPSSSKREFSYELVARNGGRSVRLESFPECVPRWVEHTPLKSFLMVPSDFVGSGQLKLEISIRRCKKFPALI